MDNAFLKKNSREIIEKECFGIQTSKNKRRFKNLVFEVIKF